MTAPILDSVLNLPGDVRMLDVVRRGLETSDDVRIAVSFTRCSGLGLLVDPLRELVTRGGRVRLLTSTYQFITQPEALEALLALKVVETRVQTGPIGFHSKFWWFKGDLGAQVWAGSSNLSQGGLATNLEWNIRRIDPDSVNLTRSQFDGLWLRPDVVELGNSFLDSYRAAYKSAQVANTPSPPRHSFLDPLLASGQAEYFHTPVVKPNEAQLEALCQLGDLRARGIRRAAVIAATGIGKTYLAAFDFLQSRAATALYVSHRLEHLTQAKRTFDLVVGPSRTGIVGGAHDQPLADIVFATIASLRRRPALANRNFEYLVIDEFHHVEAPSYEVLRPLRDRAFLLGITATPDRQDGHDVLAWCDWNVAYDVRLPEAIDRGWLRPFHYFGIADETVDFLRIPWRRLDEVEDALSVEARARHIFDHAIERGFDGPKRATIGFCAGIKHARFMAEAFTRFGRVAVAVVGEQTVEERESVYRRLADPMDNLEWVFVADILNEGVDIPSINSILFLRPTESATLFLQQLGRGLRLTPGSEVLTVLDFVGHHKSAWLALETLDAPSGGGRHTEIAQGFSIKPPRNCEVVLQTRTREILTKVSRFTSKKSACEEAYKDLRQGLDRPALPIDLWNRTDLPDLRTFRDAYDTWIECQRANSDEPDWSRGLPKDHQAFAFLKTLEANWQAQRVSVYALAWGLCQDPGNPTAGYESFFERWPQWKVERSELGNSKTWDTLRRKLRGALDGDRLKPGIIATLGPELLREAEGRLFYAINGDYQERHAGVLRRPEDLNIHASYKRPEIIRYFSQHYDPARHNTGMLWFGQDGVIITKLDTSSATPQHKYTNYFVNDSEFVWTSQNKMGTDNEHGRKLLEHEARGLKIHLFVQARSHEQAYYIGPVKVLNGDGTGPMKVLAQLQVPVPSEILTRLSSKPEI